MKNNKEIGDLGETVAVEYLLRKKFTILQRNFSKKVGEIDVIAQKEGIVHFVEVKTLTYDSKANLEYAVSHETWQPSEQIHSHKLRQIVKTAEVWLAENDGYDQWQIDALSVRVVSREKYASVAYFSQIAE